ncbi:hypothetical protein [Serinicoccus kebangsaanensis]|uniref:hypothetical protein n=1 Tax=Serinicoccus kebangsaanensis TaxID=2602069 RepID=UPI00124D4582|nr:hypothetical protein [Serinicoccus kebangsaanensis]
MSVISVGMPGSDGHPGAMSVESEVADVVDTAEQLLAAPGPGPEAVLILVPEVAARTSELARAVMHHPGMALLRVPGPPTALALVQHVTSAPAASGLTAPQHLALAQATRGAIRSLAQLASVAKLEDPRPSFGQHLLSLWPGSCFLVDPEAQTVTSAASAPEPFEAHAFVSLDRGKLPEKIPPLPTSGTDLGQLTEVAISSPWGTDRLRERSYLLRSPEEIVASAVEAPTTTCPNCRLECRDTICAFCGAVVHRRTS